METQEIFGDVVFRYSRNQALADDVLVDVTMMAMEAGFRIPVAMTQAAYQDCVAWNDSDNDRKGICQDMDGRLWDVLYMAHLAARGNPEKSEVNYVIRRVPRTGKGHVARVADLVIKIHGGDNGEAVATIMLPGED